MINEYLIGGILWELILSLIAIIIIAFSILYTKTYNKESKAQVKNGTKKKKRFT